MVLYSAQKQECYACILTFNYLKVNDCYLAWHTCQQFTLVLLKYLLCYSIKNESTEAKNENLPYHMVPLLPVACQRFIHKEMLDFAGFPALSQHTGLNDPVIFPATNQFLIISLLHFVSNLLMETWHIEI